MQGLAVDKKFDIDYLALDILIPEDHLLRKIRKCIDFSFGNMLTEPCYSPNNGRPSIPPELYFKMMLINSLYGIRSTRRLVEEIHFNISYRWFCGFTLKDTVPNHASLTRIKKRYSVSIFEEFFNTILNQCRDAGLLDSHGVMTDSTLFQANASLNSMMPLIEVDNKNIVQHEPGTSAPAKRNISNKTHQSKTDPDATLAYKAGTLRTLKYKAHLCCDSQSRIIIALKITTGAVHDSQPYLEQLDYLKAKLHLTINEVIADRAYGSGNIISIIQTTGTRHFISLFSTRSGSSTNTMPPGFKYNSENNTYTCPAKYELKPGKTAPNGYVLHHSSVINCRNCPIKIPCRAPKKKNSEIRVIARHIHFELFQEVMKNMETSEFKQKLTERLWKIEGIMNELKNFHGLFKANYRGLQNVQIQAYMAAMAINIKRMVFLFLTYIYLFQDL